MFNELKRPVNILSISIGILSIIVSLAIYYLSIKSAKPVYFVDEQRGTIFDSSITSPAIKVFDKNNQLINDDIYLVNIAFWNDGELSIEPNLIRKPLTLKISQAKSLLDYTILKQVDPNISKMQLKQTSPFELQLDWEHLDPGYGARIQLIYIGDKDAKITLEGKIVGLNIEKIQPTNKKYNVYVFRYLLLMVFGYTLGRIIDNIKKLNEKNKEKLVLKLLFAVTLSIAIYILFFKVGSVPPV